MNPSLLKLKRNYFKKTSQIACINHKVLKNKWERNIITQQENPASNKCLAPFFLPQA
jgi:hypothetical protein